MLDQEDNSLEIRLRKSVIVTGLVRERGTGRPVPGVEMSFGPLRGGEQLNGKTDAEGRYSFPSLPGEVMMILLRMPPTHVAAPGQNWKDFTVAEGAGRIELEPREALLAASPLRFVVRDEAGKPVANATITSKSPGSWLDHSADERGEIEVTGLAPGAEVTVTGRHHERRTERPVKTFAGETSPISLAIVPGLTSALTGRVLGAGGTPIAGASLKVQFRNEKLTDTFGLPQTFQFDDGIEILTGPDGTYRTPKELDKKADDFRVEVTADGFLSNQSGWIPSIGSDLIAIPDITLRRAKTLRDIAGKVIDREGRGVAGASVFQAGDTSKRRKTNTRADGQFQLTDVSSGESLLFAEKDGFRFGGVIVRPEDVRVEVRLAGEKEPPLWNGKSLPMPMTRAEEQSLAKELLQPLIPAARSGSLGDASNSVFRALARLDPDRVMEMLENRVFFQPTAFLDEVALGQLESDPAEAVATIEADFNHLTRASGFLALFDAVPEKERERRIVLVDRALEEARRAKGDEASLWALGQIADRWLEIGDIDRAKAVIREGQGILAALPRDKHSFTVEGFAEVLAVIDPAAARAILERKGQTNVQPPDAGSIDRHLGEAAVRLAAFDPAEAERLMPPILKNQLDGYRQEYLLRICRRMARVDLPRARRLLDLIDQPNEWPSFRNPVLFPYGLGLLASELAESDPVRARQLLDEAFSRLHKVSTEQKDYSPIPPISCVMAELLPMIERLEPDRLGERLWLAAGCRTSIQEQPDMFAIDERVILAMLVSRYDRAMPAVIIAPALDRLPELLADTSRNDFNNGPAFKALAAYDPRVVLALLRSLPESARKAPEKAESWNAASLDARVRIAAAQMLALPVEQRPHRAIEYVYQLWPLRRSLRSAAY